MIRHDPALLSTALAAAERAMNGALSLAPTSQQSLEALTGTVLGVEVTTLDLVAYLEVLSGEELRLMAHCETPTAAFVRGSLEDFAALATSDDPAATLINSDIEIEGSSASLIALQKIVAAMEVDWEAPIVDALGDVAGHQLAETLRGIFRWGGNASSSLRRQLSEYLLEEGRVTPPRAELEYYYESVQTLSLKVERLQAKVQRLMARAADRERKPL